MKKLALFFTLAFFTFNSFSQSRQERKAEKKAKLESQFKDTKALLDSKNLMFEARWANPLGNDVATIGMSLPGGAGVFQGNRVDVSTNTNFVKLSDINADLFLPYFGRVFFPKRVGNESGIRYKGEIKNYSLKVNEKKKTFVLKFEAKTEDDFLQFNFRINASGYTTVTVTSTNRQIISYDGTITELEEEDSN
ncbi:DUF4251 domain-containing protein [Winogradskyella jejuensis]|uniref:DUF4251 domain-containing protein n=1 Tax=Winogradskyella jejuensis TaxID=1089305 RepID=A0A1M5UDX7_9FLAO|nr:DUF4251 domain-containing protein [Winogradskyella jejuensis]SHH61265.1 protein of unknown function [Winogradskyella jejuensis]